MTSLATPSTKLARLRHLLLVELEREEAEARAALGKRIKDAREAAGLTQQELASALGLSGGQVISNYERGLVEIKRFRLRRIAELTSRTIEEIVGEATEGTSGRDADASTSDQLAEILRLLREQREMLEEVVASSGRGEEESA